MIQLLLTRRPEKVSRHCWRPKIFFCVADIGRKLRREAYLIHRVTSIIRLNVIKEFSLGVTKGPPYIGKEGLLYTIFN